MAVTLLVVSLMSSVILLTSNSLYPHFAVCLKVIPFSARKTLICASSILCLYLDLSVQHSLQYTKLVFLGHIMKSQLDCHTHFSVIMYLQCPVNFIIFPFKYLFTSAQKIRRPKYFKSLACSRMMTFNSLHFFALIMYFSLIATTFAIYLLLL